MKSFSIIILFIFSSKLLSQPCNCDLGGCYLLYPVHYHRILHHQAFNEKYRLNDEFCASVEFPFEMYVAADGTEASLLEISVLQNCCGGSTNLKIECIQLDDQDNEVGNNNTYEYGEFTYSGHTGNINRIRYKHPLKLPDDGELFYRFAVKLKSGNANLGKMYVSVYRPPVVMVHGLWSEGAAFQDMESNLLNTNEYYQEQLYKADYSSTNASSFATNTYVVEQAIEQVINQCTDIDIAAGKANVVCHSMGGLLTRKYVQDLTYVHRKDVLKIITCNTPHAGSQMANFLLDTLQYGDIVSQALSAAGMNCYNGAVSDLKVQNPNIQPINFGTPADAVKVHALTTEAAPLAASPFWGILTSVSFNAYATILAGYACGSSFLIDVFDGDQHDQIVAKQSQRGGIFSSASSSYTSQAHVGSVANSAVINQVKTLLNQQYISLTGFTSAYNSVSVQYDLNFPCLPFRGDDDQSSRNNPSVEITSPLTNSNFYAGDTLDIQFSSSMIDTVVAALNYTTDSILMLGAGSNQGLIHLPIPPKTFGNRSLVLLGIDSENKIVAIDSININFKTTSTLDSISITPLHLFMNQNDTLPITITGFYSDSIVRNLNQDDSISFQFSLNFASRIEDHFVKLDSIYSDTLRVMRNNILSNKLIIHKLGINYPASCKTVPNTNDSGVGSLRQALDCAFDNDTIVFDITLAGDTIILTNTPLIIDKSIYIINSNTQKVNIQSNGSGLVLVSSEATTTLSNLNFISNNISPSCIANYGNLTLENVTSLSVNAQCLVDNQGNGNLELKGICEFR